MSRSFAEAQPREGKKSDNWSVLENGDILLLLNWMITKIQSSFITLDKMEAFLATLRSTKFQTFLVEDDSAPPWIDFPRPHCPLRYKTRSVVPVSFLRDLYFDLFCGLKLSPSKFLVVRLVDRTLKTANNRSYWIIKQVSIFFDE